MTHAQKITRVLMVDDDAAVREALGQTLELADLTPTLAGTYIEAKDHLTRDFCGVVVSDIRMPGKDGFALLELAQSIDPDLPVILLTGEGDIPMAVRSMGAGAFDFLEKPCDPKALIGVVEAALETRKMVLEDRRLKAQINQGDAAARLLRGISSAAHNLRAETRALARTSADVLITGEPGSGSSKMAEVIHLLSAGAQAPFLKFPAASQTSDSLAAAFEAAKAGTIYLDEVAALPPAVQFSILELLEQPERPRLIVGTYADLSGKVAAGQFSPDLFYRLDGAVLKIPPLRARREDIPVLFRHYVDIACEQAGLPVPNVSQDVVARLMAQDWPGNARSLMNAAMRFSMQLEEREPEGDELGLSEQLAQVERSILIAGLQKHGGNATSTAKSLKLPRKTLYDKLARHGVQADLYRR